MAAPHYQIIRRPIITEKGLGAKETQHTVVFAKPFAVSKYEWKKAYVKLAEGEKMIEYAENL